MSLVHCKTIGECLTKSYQFVACLTSALEVVNCPVDFGLKAEVWMYVALAIRGRTSKEYVGVVLLLQFGQYMLIFEDFLDYFEWLLVYILTIQTNLCSDNYCVQQKNGIRRFFSVSAKITELLEKCSCRMRSNYLSNSVIFA